MWFKYDDVMMENDMTLMILNFSSVFQEINQVPFRN